MADRVTIREPLTQRTREVSKTAVAYFPGWEVLDSRGRVNPKATAANSTEKEN